MTMRKPITLTWEDKDYTVVVTMDVIDRLEDHINLAIMVQRCSTGDLRLSHVSKLIWLLLVEAGAEDVTCDDIYTAMHGAGNLSAGKIGVLLREIFGVIFPQPRKKSDSTSTKKTVSKKKASKKPTATRGKHNTKS